jgi:membrane-associated phospholipid phosphatase
MKIDVFLLTYLNTLDASSPFWHHLFSALAYNRFIRGAPIFASLVYVIFRHSSARQKSRLTVEFIGVFIALAISLTAQTYFSFHLRPIFNGSLTLLNTQDLTRTGWGTRVYSMPSDTATVFFALSVMVFMENKRLGLLCMAWSFLTVGISRVALAIHYPSDILGGLVLGGAMVYACSRLYIVQDAIKKNVIEKFDPEFIAFNIAVFLFCAEAYSLFPGFEPIQHFLGNLLSGKHIDWLY